MFKQYFISQLVALGFTLLFGLFAFIGIWFIAPEVGGAWWPYIRFVVSLIPSLVVASLFYKTSQLIILYLYIEQVQEGIEDLKLDEIDGFEFDDGKP